MQQPFESELADDGLDELDAGEAWDESGAEGLDQEMAGSLEDDGLDGFEAADGFAREEYDLSLIHI